MNFLFDWLPGLRGRGSTPATAGLSDRKAYNVRVTEVRVYSGFVYAETRADADRKARKMWDDKDDIAPFYNGEVVRVTIEVAEDV